MRKWFLVLNRAEARIFQQVNIHQPIVLIENLRNEIGREKTAALTEDQPGRDQYHPGKATISHSLTGGKDPHEDAAVQFVKKIAERLEHARKTHEYESLHVFSGPHLTGLLRKELSEQTSATISAWEQKNLANMTDSELDKMIRESGDANVTSPERSPKPGTPPREPLAEIPFNISFRDMESSDAIWIAIEERIGRLERFNHRVHKCDVVVSAPHQHSSHHIYHIEIRLHLPGENIIIDREPERNEAHTDIYVAIRDAFNALERKLETMMEKRRGKVKAHTRATMKAASPMHDED